jgi:hypothetical protein
MGSPLVFRTITRPVETMGVTDRGGYVHQHKILAGIILAVLAGAVGWHWRQWRDEQW